MGCGKSKPADPSGGAYTASSATSTPGADNYGTAVSPEHHGGANASHVIYQGRFGDVTITDKTSEELMKLSIKELKKYIVEDLHLEIPPSVTEKSELRDFILAGQIQRQDRIARGCWPGIGAEDPNQVSAGAAEYYGGYNYGSSTSAYDWSSYNYTQNNAGAGNTVIGTNMDHSAYDDSNSSVSEDDEGESSGDDR